MRLNQICYNAVLYYAIFHTINSLSRIVLILSTSEHVYLQYEVNALCDIKIEVISSPALTFVIKESHN
jgi:hypothetical protein